MVTRESPRCRHSGCDREPVVSKGMWSASHLPSPGLCFLHVAPLLSRWCAAIHYACVGARSLLQRSCLCLHSSLSLVYCPLRSCVDARPEDLIHVDICSLPMWTSHICMPKRYAVCVDSVRQLHGNRDSQGLQQQWIDFPV